MQVTISATSIGGNAGPFNIFQNFDSYVTPVATGVSRASILAGYVVTVNDATTTVRLVSTGTCTNSTDISVIYPSPSPTPTPTPTQTPVANIIYWSYSKTSVDSSMIIYKNGNTVVSTGTNGASGNFTHSPGDNIQVISIASIKDSDYTSVCVTKGGANIINNQQTNVDADSSFTTTAGIYYIDGCQSTSAFACNCLVE